MGAPYPPFLGGIFSARFGVSGGSLCLWAIRVGSPGCRLLTLKLLQCEWSYRLLALSSGLVWLVAAVTGIDERGDAMGKFGLGPAPAAAMLLALAVAGCGSFG